MHAFKEIGVGFALAKSGKPYWCASSPGRLTSTTTPVTQSRDDDMTVSRLFSCVLLIANLSGDAIADEPADPIVNELLAAHNFIRKRNKLEPLTLSQTLCNAAKIHARDMAKQERMSHTGSDGSNPIERAKRVGYGSSWVGENVAVSQWTVDQVMAEWMESRGHRGNILGKYTEMGGSQNRRRARQLLLVRELRRSEARGPSSRPDRQRLPRRRRTKLTTRPPRHSSGS